MPRRESSSSEARKATKRGEVGLGFAGVSELIGILPPDFPAVSRILSPD